MKKYALPIFIFAVLLLSLFYCGKHEHTPSEWIIDEESTCITLGYKYRMCLECGIVVEESYLDTYGDHVEEIDYGYVPTCVRDGLTDGCHCSVCGETIVEQRYIPSIDHNYVVTETTMPTCTTDGYKTYTCQCGYSYQELYAYALQHDGSVLDEYVPPTCTDEGYSMGYHCSRCGEVTIPQSAIEPLGHYTVTDYAVPATCTESGLTEGSHCARCELVFVAQTVIPPKGHTIRIDEGSEPTCTFDGCTDSQVCTTCYKTVVESITIPATGHTYIDYEVIEPTCSLGGYTERLCHCGYVDVVDPTDALGHDEVIDPRVEPACTTVGYTEGSHCARCGKILKYQNVIENLRHDITTVQVDPTLDADGSITETCSRCDYVNVTPIVLTDYSVPGCIERFIDHTDENGGIHVVVPAIFEEKGVWYKVVSVSSYAFNRDYKLASVVLPDTVTSIGERAFMQCYSLTSIRLSENLLSIGDYAFSDCERLVDIQLPDSLVTIGMHAFSDCKRITEIHLGNSLTEVGEYAFSLCESLRSITIPGSLRIIEPYAFAWVHSVTEIVISEGVERIEEGAFQSTDALTRLVLPDSLQYVGYQAFVNSAIVSLEIGKGDVIFDDEAFYNCYNLTVIVIGEGTKIFSPSAFLGCESLRAIHDFGNTAVTFDDPIAENVSVILKDGGCFFPNDGYSYTYTSDNLLFRYDGELYQLIAYCGLSDSVILPETVNGSAYDIYSMRGAVRVTLPSNMTVIPDYAFYAFAGLKDVTIHNGVIEIGRYAFYSTGLTEIVLPDSVELIGSSAFESCGRVKLLTLSAGLKVIGEGAFRNSGNYESVLVDVIIPDSVETIADEAFYSFTSLGKVTVGKGLSSLGFLGLGRPTYFDVSPDNECFKSIDGTIYSKDGKILITFRYVDMAEGEGFVIPEGVTTIKAYAFSFSRIYFIEMPSTLTTIEYRAFYNCFNITRIKLGSGVVSVANDAFASTGVLTELILNAKLESVGSGAFATNAKTVLYYEGIKAEWDNVLINDKGINKLGDPYFYYEYKPTTSGPYWHYDADGNPVLW